MSDIEKLFSGRDRISIKEKISNLRKMYGRLESELKNQTQFFEMVDMTFGICGLAPESMAQSGYAAEVEMWLQGQLPHKSQWPPIAASVRRAIDACLERYEAGDTSYLISLNEEPKRPEPSIYLGDNVVSLAAWRQANQSAPRR